jgi:hypothetical protein
MNQITYSITRKADHLKMDQVQLQADMFLPEEMGKL